MKTFYSFICLVAFLSTSNLGAEQLPVPTPQAAGSQTSEAVGTDVALGAPYDWKRPKYPKDALKNRIRGSVALRLSVDEKGRVTDVSVLSGNPELAEAVTHVARKWRYYPYFRGGKPTAATTLITIDFDIDSSGHPKLNAKYAEPLNSGVFRVGGGVSPPKPIHTPDPEYPEEARQLKYQGVCVLSLIVGPDGMPRDIRVAKSLGHGLDEKAIDAVRQWKFEPSKKDGRPVAVMINVEMQFRLY